MKTLLLMRHAKSSWADSSSVDFDRPLNPRGLATAPLMGAWLVDHAFVPDAIVASCAKRAQETTHLVVEACGYAGAVEWRQDLYLASAQAIIRAIQSQSATIERLLLVGHNPGLEHLISELTNNVVPFPTAAVAVFQANISNWAEASDFDRWELIEMVRPKEM